MEYIKYNHNEFSFPENFVQVFQNKFVANAAMEKEIVRKRMNNELTSLDVKICEFVNEHTFATYEMLADIAGISDDGHEDFKKHIDKLVLFRILNRFILAESDDIRPLPDDALFIYNIDMGGKYFLDHYSKMNMSTWNVGVVGYCPSKIARLLATADFHAKLLASCPKKLREFKCTNYRIGKDIASISFEFKLDVYSKATSQMVSRYFLGDVVRRVDGEVDFRERVEAINSICSTNIWKKFWPKSDNPPIVLFIAEDEEMMNELFQIMRMYRIPKFFITTDERLRGGLKHPEGLWVSWSSDLEMPQPAKTAMFIDK